MVADGSFTTTFTRHTASLPAKSVLADKLITFSCKYFVKRGWGGMNGGRVNLQNGTVVAVSAELGKQVVQEEPSIKLRKKTIGSIPIVLLRVLPQSYTPSVCGTPQCTDVSHQRLLQTHLWGKSCRNFFLTFRLEKSEKFSHANRYSGWCD